MEKNLFTKLLDRLNMTKSTLNSTVKKRIGALTIATTLGLSTLGLTSCDILNQVINPDNSTYSSTNDSSLNSSTGGNNGNNSKYSQLLQNILDDSEINSLITEATKDYEVFTSAQLDPHPYAFLEDEGHDIKAIKAGTLTCKTSSYVKDSEPNNLYMMTYVETKGSTPYYTEYLLKYTLTDQEMDDYEFLHANAYIQSVFMNNEISENKRETVVNKAKISVKAHENFKEAFEFDDETKHLIESKSLDVMLKEFSVSDDTFTLYIFPRATMGNTMTYYGNIGEFPLKGSDSWVQENNGIMISPSSGSLGSSFRSKDFNAFKESLEPITLYSSQIDTTRINVLSNN